MNSFVRCGTFIGIIFCVGASAPRAPESIIANDNRHPAGTLENGVLTVHLEARSGLWRPEGEHGGAIPIAAWAEVGKPMSVPGPLLRVPAGTKVRASLHNSLDKPLTVFGFGKTRGMSDSVVIPAARSLDVEFDATSPGTFYYFARRGVDSAFFGVRHPEDMLLGGAIVVDAPGAPVTSTDRIFVVSFWFTMNAKSPTGLSREVFVINGLSWPHTERIDLTQGDSVHWRVINLTELDHPMHLHGFYFRVKSRGDGVNDSLFASGRQWLAVTEIVLPFQTMSLSWIPDRPGNWIYHCHFADHIARNRALDVDSDRVALAAVNRPEDGPQHEMHGLVLGLRVRPNGELAKVADAPRRIRMIVRQKRNGYGAHDRYAMVVDDGRDSKVRDTTPVPGPTLVLERGRPVAITVVNQAQEHTSIHWHGIELQSYPDGVPGWSGSGNKTLPSIAPGDSITVDYTPPRAGTFMYHSHFDESAQISGGLYGPIIVVEPGERYDPERNRVLFFGIAGPTTNVIFGPFAPYIMNGAVQPDAINLRHGTTYRFRLINLVDGGPALVTLQRDSEPVMWRALAKDGADLAPAQATPRPAMLLFDPGEIYDFELTPDKPGDLALSFGVPPLPPGFPWPANVEPLPPRRTVTVHVH